MAGPVVDGASKRKRQSESAQARKRAKSEEADGLDKEAISQLESEVLQSKKNYNNISILISAAKGEHVGDDMVLAASVSLCRVFMKLLASGALGASPDLSEKDAVVCQWLRDRLADYKRILLVHLSFAQTAPAALALAMQLLKAEAEGHGGGREEPSFPKQFYTDIVTALLLEDTDEVVRQEFIEKFVSKYDDLRLHLFKSITYGSPQKPRTPSTC